jgi:DNA-directed RNA polymerase sigma subunit (sigma70/sigma32)
MLTNPVTVDLARYLRRPNRFSILEAEEEARLARRWREHSDREAANKLLTSQLRLVGNLCRWDDETKLQRLSAPRPRARQHGSGYRAQGQCA